MHEVTRILNAIEGGDAGAIDALLRSDSEGQENQTCSVIHYSRKE